MSITLSKDHPEFPCRATLDDLEALSPNGFGFYLAVLRGEREPNWQALEIRAEDRPRILAQKQAEASAWLRGCARGLLSAGLLTVENCHLLECMILDLHDAARTKAQAKG